MALPVVALDRATVGETLLVMATVDAVDVPVVAVSAEMEELPARVDDALDLPEIVHSLLRPPGTGPPRGTRATTTLVERVHSRRPEGSEVMLRAFSFGGGRRDRRPRPTAGPTTASGRAAQISALFGAR
jgi:hypothetical protein